MNLKDRLENIRTTNVLSIKGTEEVVSNFDVEQVFLDSDDVKRILIQAVTEGKNILFLSRPTMECSLLTKYFKQLFASKEADVVFPKNLFDDVLVYENRINLIPSPSMNEIVNIFEKIMYGYKSFVFGFTLGSPLHSLSKIKTALALNCKNLSSENIEVLLGTSDLILVNFDKNSDGLYFVSQIEKVEFENYKADTLTLFEASPIYINQPMNAVVEESPVLEEVKEEVIDEKVEVQIEVDSVQEEQAVNVEIEQKNQDEAILGSDIQEEIKEETPKKRNKYSVLKEKVKRKKGTIQE